MTKPLLVALSCLMIIFSSCSKTDDPIKTEEPKEEKFFSIQLSVSTFNKEISSMASSEAGMKNYSKSSGSDLYNTVNELRYFVYNKDGSFVKTLISKESDDSFGVFDDNLPNGNYTIVIVGTKAKEGSFTYGESSIDYAGVSYHFSGDLGDVFSAKVSFEVKGDDISEAVVLKRVVGNLEISLLDSPPPSTSKITYTITGIATYFPFEVSTSNVGTLEKSYDIVHGAGESGKEHLKYSTFFFLGRNADALATVNIKAYDNTGKLVANKIITDIPVGVNKKTTLEGNLFDSSNSAGQSLPVSIDKEWRSDISKVNF